MISKVLSFLKKDGPSMDYLNWERVSDKSSSTRTERIKSPKTKL